MSDTSQCTDSDDEHHGNGPFADPYTSTYGFTATSWALRKNLSETFNQHVIETKPSKEAKKREMAKSSSVPVAKKQLKLRGGRQPALNKSRTGKPPRNPLSSNPYQLNSKMSEDKGKVSVYLRVRPPQGGMSNTIEIVPNDPPTKIRTYAPAKSNAAKINREKGSSAFQSEPLPVVREFEFEEVFGPETQNDNVYAKVVAPMVERMIPGVAVGGKDAASEPESGLLFAYGATNAGKTYSMLGRAPVNKKDDMALEQKHWGIVPRAIADIIQKSAMAGRVFDLYLSYYEIYNENIYDLLEENGSKNPLFLREPLKLRESQNKSIIIRGLQKRQIKSVEEGLVLAMQANAKRQTSSNNLNNDSSRSHSICQLQLVHREPGVHSTHDGDAAPPSGYNTEEEAIHISKLKSATLSFVDLAGSERNKRTNVGSLRQKEASLINKSLMNLMRCLSIIRENQSAACASQIIPFRENKLTHLFMPVFTGRTASRISMIVNVNPAGPDFDETHHVLSYACQAKLVEIEKPTALGDGNARVATGEYDYNGRPIKKASTTSKLAKLVKKLSPKKLVQRVRKKDESTRDVGNARKRKDAPSITRVSSFSSTTSNGSRKVQQAKRMKVGKLATSSSNMKLPDDDLHCLRKALSDAQAEIKSLKSEKAKLTDDLAQVEEKIRFEVSEEMEEQLESTKRHYTSIIDTMKAQSRQSLGIFEKRAREEKAAEQIEVLLFKVEECEEEMKRQAEEHQAELSAKSKEIELLNNKLAKRGDDACNGSNSDIIAAQRLQISEQQQELEALKKSKMDLIAAYEKLLAGEEEGVSRDEDELESEEENDQTGDEDKTPLKGRAQQQAPRYTTRNRSEPNKGVASSNSMGE